MKTLVVYYSNTGSNTYLAEKIAHALEADLEIIRPRFGMFFFVLLFSALKISFGIKKIRHDVHSYDRVILCGPVLIGQLVSPLRDFINRYGEKIQKLYFVTCCGCSDAQKDDQFGYAKIFALLKNLLGEKLVSCEAFPITLVLPTENPTADDAIMKTRLSDKNFTGEILKRFNTFIKALG